MVFDSLNEKNKKSEEKITHEQNDEIKEKQKQVQELNDNSKRKMEESKNDLYKLENDTSNEQNQNDIVNVFFENHKNNSDYESGETVKKIKKTSKKKHKPKEKDISLTTDSKFNVKKIEEYSEINTTILNLQHDTLNEDDIEVEKDNTEVEKSGINGKIKRIKLSESDEKAIKSKSYQSTTESTMKKFIGNDVKEIHDINQEKLLKIINSIPQEIDEKLAITIFSFLLELERHPINVELKYQKQLQSDIMYLLNKLRPKIPEKIRHFEIKSIFFQDDQKERRIPFSLFLSDYLISFFIKLNTREIENCVQHYFFPTSHKFNSGVEIILGNALKSAENFYENEKKHKLFLELDLPEDEKLLLEEKKQNINLCITNKILLQILRQEDYNINLFRTLLKYPEQSEKFILYLYINSEEVYRIFLKNVLNNCNSEQQSEILRHFYDVQIDDLQFFDKQNIAQMILRKMKKATLSQKILDLPREEILELVRENFEFFKSNFDAFNITSRELLQTAEESDEILEYLFDNSQKFGVYMISSTMRILSNRTLEYTFKFFKNRITELDKMCKNQKIDENTVENDKLTQKIDSICEAILVYIKHNQPGKELLKIFKSEYLMNNSKYFFSVLTILDKNMIRSKLFDFLDYDTFSLFINVVSANEIIDELCFINYGRFSYKKNEKKEKLIQILDQILPKISEDNVIQALVQAESGPSYLVVLQKCLQHYPTLISFAITSLEKITSKSSEYIEILEMLNQNIIDVLVTKDSSFIDFCISRSSKIREISNELQNKQIRGIEKVKRSLENFDKQKIENSQN